jgi:hypothetical protein
VRGDKVRLWKIAFSILALAFALREHTAEAALPTEPVADTVNTKGTKLSGTFVVETLASLNKNDADKRVFSGFYVLALAAETPDAFIYSLKVPYTREYTYERDDGSDGQFGNVGYGLSKRFSSFQIIDSLSLSVGGAVGYGADSERSTFRGSIGPGLSVKKNFSRFTLVESLLYRYAFYEYDIQDNGTVNSPHNFVVSSDLSFKISQSLSALFSLTLFHNISFQGVGKSSAWPLLSLEYLASEHLSFGAGLSTLRGTLAPDGQSNQIRLIDPETSQIFLDISLLF